MADRYLYPHDAPDAPDLILAAGVALDVAGVDLAALPWVMVDLGTDPPTATAHERAEEGVPAGESSPAVAVSL